MRLSFSFLEPDELREGVRRLGVAIRSLAGAERPLRARATAGLRASACSKVTGRAVGLGA